MHDTIEPATADFIHKEEQRLVEICAAADRYSRERKEQLRAHDQKIRALKAERLNSINPREIDKLTFEIERLSQYDPAKYLIPFEQMAAPYLAGITIRDNDPATDLGKNFSMWPLPVPATGWLSITANPLPRCSLIKQNDYLKGSKSDSRPLSLTS